MKVFSFCFPHLSPLTEQIMKNEKTFQLIIRPMTFYFWTLPKYSQLLELSLNLKTILWTISELTEETFFFLEDKPIDTQLTHTNEKSPSEKLLPKSMAWQIISTLLEKKKYLRPTRADSFFSEIRKTVRSTYNFFFPKTNHVFCEANFSRLRLR